MNNSTKVMTTLSLSLLVIEKQLNVIIYNLGGIR